MVFHRILVLVSRADSGVERGRGAFIGRQDAQLCAHENQAQLIPGIVAGLRSDAIATRSVAGDLTASPSRPTQFVRRPLHPDRLRRRTGSGSLPRILVDQPVHARAADHFSAGRRRDHGRPRGGRSSRPRLGRCPL